MAHILDSVTLYLDMMGLQGVLRAIDKYNTEEECVCASRLVSLPMPAVDVG